MHGPVPMWDLKLVLPRFVGPPFETLAACSLLHLSVKMAFLVAITSTRRVGELHVLMFGHSSKIPFFKDKVYLYPPLGVCPKSGVLVSCQPVNFLTCILPEVTFKKEKRKFAHTGCQKSSGILH